MVYGVQRIRPVTILSMYIAAGVCTPQGVWIRAIGRTVSLFTGRHSELRHISPRGYKRLRGFIGFCLNNNHSEFLILNF